MAFYCKFNRAMVLLLLLIVIHPVGVFAAEKLGEGIKENFNIPATGDLPTMIESRLIRALVPYSKTFYFLDGATQRGATYELLKAFEKDLNTQLKTKHLKLHIVVIPTARDRLIPALAEGLGDIAAGNLTITKERLEKVDFAEPMAKGVSEIVVAAPSAPLLKSQRDLSGREVYVRRSSSYFSSLTRLNKEFSSAGIPPVKIVLASDYLEDEDLLEMVNADLIPLVVVDDHKAKFWTKVFEKIKLYPDVKVNSGGEIAWAVRKNNPQLKKIVSKFIKKNKKGTLLGNIIINRYLKNTKYVKNNLQSKDRKRFNATIELFKKYGQKYSFDWLMLAALAYQESTIDQSKRSRAGAVGVMQILPSTAKDKNVGVSGIEKVEANIHAGTKYLRFMVDRYFNEPGLDELNRGLFAFAAYNAGPAKLSKLRREAAAVGFDPNVWFRNVEVIAAKRIGRETVQYVSNIFKYYTAYSYLADQEKRREKKEK